MPHIHTGPGHHDHTVSAYIIKYDGVENGYLTNPRLLVHMHKKFGKLLQPGGHVELNENPWAALTHEINEETGYDMDQLTLLQPNTIAVTKLSNPTAILHPIPFYSNSHDASTADLDGVEHRHTDTAYLFVTDEEPRHALGEDESQDLRWLTVDEVLASTETSAIVKDSAPVAFAIIESHAWRGQSALDFKTSL